MGNSELTIKKGYKQTDVGIIPEDWDLEILENLSTAIGDGIHSTPEYVDSSEFYFINGNNLVDNAIRITENTKCVSGKEYRKYQLKLNDKTILLSINGTIGNLAYYNNEPVILGKSAAYISTKKSTSKEFIFYLLQTETIKQYFEDELTGSTIRNLSLKSIRNTPIKLPPLPEQQAIAEVLSDVDALIASLDQLITKKRNIKQGAMQLLLTGKKRLVAESKKGCKQTDVGLIPEDWSIKPLKEISSLKGRIGWQGLKQTEFTMNEDEPFLITGMNFKDGEIRWDEVYHISVERYGIAKEIQLKPDDVLMTKDGTIGKMLFVDSIPYPHKASLNSHLLLFRPIQKSYIPKFLY